MHFNKHNLIGQKFGRLTVISETPNRGSKVKVVYWLCECECGTIKEVNAGALKAKEGRQTLSCGCLASENAGKLNFKHGLWDHPLHGVWWNIICRCERPDDIAYHNYGGKGIFFWPEWRNDFKKFYDDNIEGYKQGLQFDRYPDKNGNYVPGNVRWATGKQNSRNKNTNVLLTIDGEVLCIAEWAERSGNSWIAIKHRLNKGLSHKDAVFLPRYYHQHKKI